MNEFLFKYRIDLFLKFLEWKNYRLIEIFNIIFIGENSRLNSHDKLKTHILKTMFMKIIPGTPENENAFDEVNYS